MVALKWLFLSALATVSVLAQTDDDAGAAAYWNVDIADGAEDGPNGKRSVHARNDPDMKDPYWGYHCKHDKYTLPPCETTCNRNNCFRGFLNARDGSDGKHCPKEAFAFCCIWNSCPFPHYKKWAVESGCTEDKAPYTKNCKGDKDSTWDIVKKIDDACGCTLNHEVKVDSDSDYYKLHSYKCHDKKCH